MESKEIKFNTPLLVLILPYDRIITMQTPGCLWSWHHSIFAEQLHITLRHKHTTSLSHVTILLGFVDTFLLCHLPKMEGTVVV